MLYREIEVACSENHTKRTNTLCGQNVEFLNVNPCGLVVNSLLLVITLLVNKFLAFCEIQLIVTVFAQAHHRSTSGARLIRVSIRLSPYSVIKMCC
jgi:hypothetical protein